ncbi:MAG: hypothetical protein ACOCY7_04555 [Halodesulfurarchaeum sp.]
MVEEEIRDGDRIADLLAHELEGFEEPPFDSIRIVEPAVDDSDASGGDVAFSVDYRDQRLCEIQIQPDRILLEFRMVPDSIVEAAQAVDLRVRPKATDPPSTLLFVERGADVKRVIDVLRESLPDQ